MFICIQPQNNVFLPHVLCSLKINLIFSIYETHHSERLRKNFEWTANYIAEKINKADSSTDSRFVLAY